MGHNYSGFPAALSDTLSIQISAKRRAKRLATSHQALKKIVETIKK